MLANLLKAKNVKIEQKATEWQEAVRISLQDLLDGGYVEESYIDSVIESTIHYGPYYVLAENVALIHGRPEEGVREKQLAVTLLREPVQFSEDGHPVRLMIALAATDSESHLDAMRVLASVLGDEAKIQEMLEARTPQALYQMSLNAEKEIEE